MDFKKPKLPALSSKTPSDIRRAINAIAEYLGGVADKSSRLNQNIRNLDETVKNIGDYPPQPAPTGFAVSGGFNTIFLEWDQSKTSGFAYTEVWRATGDNLSLAVQVGTTSAPMFSDTPPDARLSATYYYWIRYVNEAGQPGPYNSEHGTPGSTADEPGYVLEVLTEEITEGQLYKDLNERIDKIEVNETAIATEQTQRQEADAALAQDITTVSAVVDDNSAAIQTEQTARIDGDNALATNISTLQVKVDGNTTSLQTKAEVTDLEAVYEVKTDINGRVTGFGLVADATSTEFGIYADRFWVADPSDSANVKIPFVIDSGQVVVDTALIKNGTITNAKIANLAVDNAKLASAAVTEAKIGNAAVTNAKIANAAITNAKIDNAAVTNAKIANAAITNAKIGDAEVDTLKIAGNAVTVPGYASGAYVAEVTITLSCSSYVTAVATITQGDGKYGHWWRLYVDGDEMQADKPIDGTLGALSASKFCEAGSVTVKIECDTKTGDGRCGVTALGTMR